MLRMIRVLILLNEIGLDGVTDSVFSYIKHMKTLGTSDGQTSDGQTSNGQTSSSQASSSQISSSQAATKEMLVITFGYAKCHNKKVFMRMKELGVNISRFPDRKNNPLRYFYELIRYVRKQKINIVHAHGNSATLAVEMTAARLAGCEIRIAHCHSTSCTHPQADRLLRPLLYRNCTQGLACGKEAGNWLFRGRPFITMPNGQDTSRFLFQQDARSRIRKKLGLREDELAIGHVGNFTKVKNHGFIIDIFKEIQRRSGSCKLFLFGDGGSEKPEVIKQIKDNGLSRWISMEGYKSDIEHYLWAMDIMILPSLYEGLPNVAIQFQISGLPVLLSDSITKECRIAEGVEFLPLAAGAAEWAARILAIGRRSRNTEPESIKNIVSRSGFDIVQNAEDLRGLYRKLYRKPKKIFFVIGAMGGGGAERVALLLANHFSQDNYDVSIVTFTTGKRQYENRCRILPLNETKTITQIIQLSRLFRRNRPDIIVAFEYHVAMKTIMATRGVKAKVIVSERNDPNRLNSLLKRKARNILFRAADSLVCQTKEAASCFPKAVQKQARIIANPVKSGLPVWDSENCRKVIVNFCRLNKQKNLPLLIRAYRLVHKEYPDFKLLIIGDGEEKDHLQALVSRHGMAENITIMPFMDDVHSLVSSCMIYVSTSDFEGLSNSMLEAMAMGMPVISTDCPAGGAREWIRHYDNGMLIPVNDPAAAARSIIEVIRNRDLRIKIGRNAYMIRERLAVYRIAQQWQELF